jgi:hypothetical protein
VMDNHSAVTHPSPHVGSKVLVPSNTGARYERLSSRGPTAFLGRDAHAAVEPDAAFVERLHAQLDDAFSRISHSTKPMRDVQSPRPSRAEP